LAVSESVLGALTTKSDFAVEPPQRDAWLVEIAVKDALHGLEEHCFSSSTSRELQPYRRRRISGPAFD
jgi:hypothetical protein